jgi:two-component system LytT family response regulator
LDYLLKPVESDRMEKALEGAMKESSPQDESHEATVGKKYLGAEDQIFIKDGDNCWFVSLKEVVKFESIGNYVRVYFKDQKPLILKSLNKLEGRLNTNVFFRANRKFIINLDWIDNIENMYNGGLKVILKEGSEVEISRRQSAKFKNALSL